MIEHDGSVNISSGGRKGLRDLASLKAVLQEIKNVFTRRKAKFAKEKETEKDPFHRGWYAGYENGMKDAIEIGDNYINWRSGDRPLNEMAGRG